MNRILEFSPSQEEAVVSRILVLVHQAVDEHFPSAGHANRKFTKTVFSDNVESTAPVRTGETSHAFGDELETKGFGSTEDTSPDGRPAAVDGVPPPPPSARGAMSPPPPPFAANKAAAGQSAANSTSKPSKSGPAPADARAKVSKAEAGEKPATAPTAEDKPAASRPTRLETSMTGINAADGPDWVTRITLALLVAGLLLLAYVLFA